MGLLLYLAVVEGGPGVRRRRERRRRWRLPVAATPRWRPRCWRGPLHGHCRSTCRPMPSARCWTAWPRWAPRWSSARANPASRATLACATSARRWPRARCRFCCQGNRKRPDHRRRADPGAGDPGRRRPAAGPSGGAGRRRRAGQRLRAGLCARAGPGPGAPGAAGARGADARRGAAGPRLDSACDSAWPSRPNPPMPRWPTLPATVRSSCGPGKQPPRSVASGILDDETYDWLAVLRGVAATGGSTVVVDEDTLRTSQPAGSRNHRRPTQSHRLGRPGRAAAPAAPGRGGPGLARGRAAHRRATLKT